jgi:hypothetical protein
MTAALIVTAALLLVFVITLTAAIDDGHHEPVHVGATEEYAAELHHATEVRIDDEFTTDVERYVALVADCAAYERDMLQLIDAWWVSVLKRLGVTELDLQDHDGFAGVRELVAA